MSPPRGQGRAAIVASAREVFAQRGYHVATIREISQAAGVSKTLLLRYFGSKAALFEEAFVSPHRGFFDAFFADLDLVQPTTADELLRRLAAAILDYTEANEGRLLDWFAATGGADDFVPAAPEGDSVHRLAEYLREHSLGLDLRTEGLEASLALMIGMATSPVVLRGVFLAGGVDFAQRDELVAEMSRIMRATLTA